MDTENKRVNVDSAKKRAVLQRTTILDLDMDYEGFRQMVLGANIFPTKSVELYSFTRGSDNSTLDPNKIFDQKNEKE